MAHKQLELGGLPRSEALPRGEPLGKDATTEVPVERASRFWLAPAGASRFRGAPRGAKYPLLESASGAEGHLWGFPVGQRHCFVVT